MTRKIVVIGYPRSGNTWVARTLGDILESPVGGGFGAKPLCTEGQERKGAFHVQQLHLKPLYDRDTNRGAYEISVPDYDGSPKLVVVVRDPRDVAVSVNYYWNINSMDRSLMVLAEGTHPLGVHGPWSQHVTEWLDCPLPYVFIRYEDMHSHPRATWDRVMDELTQHYETTGERFRYREERIQQAIDRQEFKTKKEQIERDGDGRPYGKTIQQKHLRKGKVGDWKNHLDEEQRLRAKHYFGEAAKRLGYDL